jgi:predicted PurR-regulated permease PerM
MSESASPPPPVPAGPPIEHQRFSTLLFYAAVLLLGYLLFLIVEPFLVQLGWAAVLAICFYPFYEKLARRLGPGRGALASVLIVLALVVAPAAYVTSALINEGGSVVGNVQDALTRGAGTERANAAWGWVAERSPVALPPLEDVKAWFLEKLGGLAGGLAARAGGVARDLLVFVFNLLLTLIAFFFLLRDGPAIQRAIRGILPLDEAHKDRLIALNRELVTASVTAGLVIGLIQGLIGGVTFALLGIHAPVLWGVVMAVTALLPLVGATLVWLPTALWLLVTGEPVRGAVLLAVGILVLGNVDNVVRPWLLSGKATMSGLVILIALMGGVSAFGFIGVVLGPLVVATATALLESYTRAPTAGVELTSPP